MGTHMKTTVEISDPLLNAARRLAEREGTTVRTLMEQGLRKVIAERQKSGGRTFQLRRASFKGAGLAPEAQGADWQRIRELAYGKRGG
jgi:hypothetical protein